VSSLFFFEANVSDLSFDKINNHHHGQDQANFLPSSEYQSSSNLQSTSSESNPLEFLSSVELDTINFDDLINFLSSEPRKQTEPLKNSTGQVDSAFGTVY